MTMAKSKYPYNAFVVSAAMVVKEVTVVEPAYIWTSAWERTADRKLFSKARLHKTRSEAIENGERQCEQQEKRLKIARANLAKRRANLAKAKEVA